MRCTPAPACKTVLAEATAIAPNRSKASDGICASPKHTQANPTSDHENGDAVDLTHDPAHGCNVDLFFAHIVKRRDPRVKYLIWNKRICRSYDKPGIPAWTWAPYSGSNPHDKHGHISIVPEARNNTAPWFTGTITQEAPDMDAQQNQMLIDIDNRVENAEAGLQAIAAGVNGLEKQMAEVLRRLDAGQPANAGNASISGKYTITVEPKQ